MSLNYIWFSTMWGVYVFAGAAGSSMSLLILIITWLRSSGYLKGGRLDRALPHDG
jgi:cellobiose-specific phosphotransferase system component IIC